MACGFVKISRGKVSTGIAIIVIIFIFSSSCPDTKAQTNTAFNPTDKFSIPEYNGSLSFGVNGTYSRATFENNSWTFTNLRLTGSQPLENFEISTQDSNVTIFSYLPTNNTGFQTVRLRYAVEGKGKQILNLGLGSEKEGWQWSVSFNGATFGEGNGWNISHNGTLVVNGATGNVSIVRYDYGSIAPSNLPFYQQHSIAIITALGVVVTVIVVVVIKVTSRKHSNESELVKNT
jgi:hypothetical protein